MESSTGRKEVRRSYLDRGRGVLPWLFSLDHKRIAVLYLAGVVLSFAAGSLLAVAFRSQLLYPASHLMPPAVFSRLFTLHGAMMVFLVLLPAIPAALGGFVLPLMLRARNVALPRLYLAGFHLYLLGATLLMAAVITGATDTGWDFLPPYSLTTGSSVALTVLGAVALSLSALATAVTLLVTVQTLRPAGMGWSRLPLFAWSLYVQSAVLIVSLPLLSGTLPLLLAERLGGFGVLTPAAGGDPVLFEQLFWFAAHPAVYASVLPALGVVAEILATFSGRAVAGYRTMVGAFMAMGICSFLGWGIHLVAGDTSGAASVVASFLALSVAVPASLILLNLLATLRGGALRLRSPMVLALGSLVLATAGAATGLFRALLPAASVVAGTTFETGSLHYLVLGGTFTAFLAGLHYWWPKLSGRVYRERTAMRTAQIAFAGFNLAFLPQLLLGVQGVPRRIATYSVKHYSHYTLQWLSSMGVYLLVAALFLVALYFRRSLSWPMTAPADPWGGRTAEWETSSPPPVGNFDDLTADGPRQRAPGTALAGEAEA